MLLNWTCRLAKDSKLGWDVWFSSKPLRRFPTMAALVMFMIIATTLNWKGSRESKRQTQSITLKWLLKRNPKCDFLHIPRQWEHQDSSTDSWSNGDGGCGSPELPPLRSTWWTGWMPLHTDPRSSPSWTCIVSGALSGTATRSTPHQWQETRPTTWHVHQIILSYYSNKIIWLLWQESLTICYNDWIYFNSHILHCSLWNVWILCVFFLCHIWLQMCMDNIKKACGAFLENWSKQIHG